MPREHGLSATLMIEIPDPQRIRAVLDRLIGIDEHVHLDIAGSAVPAEFDSKQFEADRISAVQYVRFELGSELAARFQDPSVAVALRVDHPAYDHETAINGEIRASLTRDLEPEPLQSLIPVRA